MEKSNGLSFARFSGGITAFVAFIALIGVSTSAYAGSMGNGAKQRNQAVVNRCLAMPHDKMMADQGCTSQMAVHPELWPPGTVPPSASTHH